MHESQESSVPIVLGLAFALEVAAPGWAPDDREAWLLENEISVPVAVWLVLVMGYELIDWAAPSILEPEWGMGFVGAQG